jgi:hypothetical protein
VFCPFITLIFLFYYNSIKLTKKYIKNKELNIAGYVNVPMASLGGFLVCATFLDRAVYVPMYWSICLGVVHRYIYLENM